MGFGRERTDARCVACGVSGVEPETRGSSLQRCSDHTRYTLLVTLPHVRRTSLLE